MTRITIVRDDITRQDVDAIVNAANPSLLGGGGVDGAIHRVGGPEVLAACRDLRAGPLRGGLPTGDAVATTAGELPARWVIHTVGPVYAAVADPATLLERCHTAVLRVADELGARSVALPAISCGAYGYPLDEAAPVAVGAVRRTTTRVREVRFVLASDAGYGAFTAALDTFPAQVAPAP
ncbi:MAG TPA: O-acetyl-ADP-ribose deacetylase [Mycobacteriales bacterium]|nr:O-acetyl-ADP-ribose deacetylase [Mycobacteriales bacterium]